VEYSVLSRVIDELAAILPGSRVDRVLQVRDASLVLVLHSRERRTRALLVAAERALPRLHLLSEKPPVSIVSSPFFLLLKKHLTGSRVLQIALLNDDRVVELRFRKMDREQVLIFELLGMSTNLILTDPGRRILAVLRPVSPEMETSRPLIPGIVYAPPEPMRHRLTGEARDVLPAMRSDVPPEFAVNNAVEAMYEQQAEERERASLRLGIAGAVKRALGRAERRCEAVQRDIDAAEQGDLHRLCGELILENLPRLKRGLEQVDLPTPNGVLHRVALDPARTPAENAERYFRRYKKAKAGLAIMRERLSEAREEKLFLGSLERKLASAGDHESLLELRRSLAERGFLRGEADAISKSREFPQPYRTISFEGWDILIGKSAAGNDYLTMHLARPDDLWLHAEGMPGSHVLIRNPQKRDIPPTLLAKAASLAAYYSKGRGSAKVPVAYTFARHVQKSKGAAPGTVLLREHKCFMAAPHPA
jgi:predicted ribosome quality control (RQC) complex YloA/Tae2 family protein